MSIEKARSSHVLVRPTINGQDVGPFILDTGASGLVISSAAAEKLNLRAFGEVFVSGVSGKVPCRFRRADALTLGPITVEQPVFMEMDVEGIVTGASEPVAGIVGFDAFKSSVLEVGPGGSPVRLYDPATFVAPASWTWHPLLMVSNVPHVAANFAGAPGCGPQIFMIDSGAGGADCIFHARAVKELGLRRLLPPVQEGKPRASSKVRGVGGSSGESSGATKAYRGTLEWLHLCTELPGADEGGVGYDFAAGVGSGMKVAKAVAAGSIDDGDDCAWDGGGGGGGGGGGNGTDAEYAAGQAEGGKFAALNVLLASDAGFDLSEHSCGLICANALNTRRVIYDLPNRRMALLLDGVDEPVPSTQMFS